MTYPDDIKAQVLAALLQGQSVNGVAKAYKIPRQTVQGWKAAAGLQTSALPGSKKHELGELIAAYLTESLTTLRAQAEVFREPQWLKKQPASEVAVLHGVLADKCIRLLEAATAAERATEDSDT